MKKFLLIFFLCVLMFVFGAAGSLHAGLLDIGSGENDRYIGSGNYKDNNNDIPDNINLIIDAWNAEYDGDPFGPNLYPPYPLPYATGPVDPYKNFEIEEGPKTYPMTWAGDWTYLTAKYGNYFDVIYIVGLNTYSWHTIVWPDDKSGKGLSHWRLWNQISVPEPATMLLVGFSLIGLGVLGRKKLFKKS